MEAKLPILPTVCVGSYASPGWLSALRDMLRDGRFGERDEAELFDDLISLCVSDQLDADVDIISDGEFRRQRSVLELYGAPEELERHAPEGRLGIAGYDKAPRFRRTDQDAPRMEAPFRVLVPTSHKQRVPRPLGLRRGHDPKGGIGEEG
jgi:hypothetical protein